MPTADRNRRIASWDSETLYGLLRAVASNQLAEEPTGQPMQTTDLVHEAWLRMRNDHGVDPEQRRLFRYQAARAMRRILVDEARRRGAQKRDPGRDRITLHDEIAIRDGNALDILEVGEAIEELRQKRSIAADLAEQLLFGSLGVSELALEMGRPEDELEKEKRFLLRWLRKRLRKNETQ